MQRTWVEGRKEPVTAAGQRREGHQRRSLAASLLLVQRTAGNRAASGLVQRAVGLEELPGADADGDLGADLDVYLEGKANQAAFAELPGAEGDLGHGIGADPAKVAGRAERRERVMGFSALAGAQGDVGHGIGADPAKVAGRDERRERVEGFSALPGLADDASDARQRHPATSFLAEHAAHLPYAWWALRVSKRDLLQAEELARLLVALASAPKSTGHKAVVALQALLGPQPDGAALRWWCRLSEAQLGFLGSNSHRLAKATAALKKAEGSVLRAGTELNAVVLTGTTASTAAKNPAATGGPSVAVEVETAKQSMQAALKRWGNKNQTGAQVRRIDAKSSDYRFDAAHKDATFTMLTVSGAAIAELDRWWTAKTSGEFSARLSDSAHRGYHAKKPAWKTAGHVWHMNYHIKKR